MLDELLLAFNAFSHSSFGRYLLSGQLSARSVVEPLIKQLSVQSQKRDKSDPALVRKDGLPICIDRLFSFFEKIGVCSLVDSDLKVNRLLQQEETCSTLHNPYVATILKNKGHVFFGNYLLDSFFSFMCVVGIATGSKKLCVFTNSDFLIKSGKEYNLGITKYVLAKKTKKQKIYDEYHLSLDEVESYVSVVTNFSEELESAVLDVKKELKLFGAFCKVACQYDDRYAKYVGIDLCTGISQEPDMLEKKQYVKDWLLTFRSVRKRDMIKEVAKQISVHHGKVSIDEFVDNIHDYLTSGSLVFNHNSEYRIRRKQIQDEKGIEILNKHGITLVMTRQEIKDMILYGTKHDISVVSAADYNKPRYIASAEIGCYLRMKFIEVNHTLKGDGYINGNYFQLTPLCSLEQQLRDNVNSHGYRYKVPLDYAKFDFQPTKYEVCHAIRSLFGSHFLTEQLIASICSGGVYLGSDYLGRYENGIPSGWLWTNLLDSVINASWVLFACSMNNYVGNWLRVNGDDVDFRSNDPVCALDIPSALNELELSVHKDKTSFRLWRSEYLRTLTGYPVEYGCRAINSVIDINLKNSTELTRSLMGDVSQIYERLNKWKILFNRFGCSNCIYNGIMEAKLWLMYRGNSAVMSMSYLAWPALYGGIGLQELPSSLVVPGTITISEPKAESGDIYMSLGAVRYIGKERVEMREKKINLVLPKKESRFKRHLAGSLIRTELGYEDSIELFIMAKSAYIKTSVSDMLMSISNTDLLNINEKLLLSLKLMPRRLWRRLLSVPDNTVTMGISFHVGVKYSSLLNVYLACNVDSFWYRWHIDSKTAYVLI